MTAKTTAQKALTKGLCEQITIDARELEEKAMMAAMMVAWVTGLVLILKANFITEVSGEM
jgi:hypothetical protein